METDDFEFRNIETIKKELIRQKNIVSYYEEIIQKIEVFYVKIAELKNIIKKSQFYQNIESKEDLLEIFDSEKRNIVIEKVNNNSIIFYIYCKGNRDKKLLFRCEWDYIPSIGCESVNITVESKDIGRPIEIEYVYTELKDILCYQLTPTEYLTIIMLIFFTFDNNNVLNNYELNIYPDDIDKVNSNIFMICHTRNAKKNNRKK